MIRTPRRGCRLLFAMMLLALAHPATSGEAAASRAVTLPNAEAHSLHSKINGSTYELFVLLPPDYLESGVRYPVLYLLDGNSYFPLAAALQTRFASEGGFRMPIIVCIGYPNLNGVETQAVERMFDYPTLVAKSTKPRKYNAPEPPPTRGADLFLSVIEKEIVPYIDSAYRTEPGVRGLGGHSLGGFFTAHTLFTRPLLFQRYWISSPTIVWDDDRVLREEEAYARGHKDLDARVYIVFGDVEVPDMVDNVLKLTQTVSSRGYPGLQWTQEVLKGQPHTTVSIVSAANAIYALYGPRIVELDAARLARLSGNYLHPDGRVITLRSDGRRLLADNVWNESVPHLMGIQLMATSPDEFITRLIGVSMKVLDEDSLVLEISEGKRPPARLVRTEVRP